MSLDFSEDNSVEKPAIQLLKDQLGYGHENYYEEQLGEDKERLNRGEVLLKKRLFNSLKRINPNQEDFTIKKAIEILEEDKSTLTLSRANQEIYNLIKKGIKVKVDVNGEEEIETIKLIDFNNPENNDFLAVNQLWVQGEVYKKRPDVVLFVNGIPLVVIELKASHKNLKNGFTQNIGPYKNTIPKLFWYNAFILLSNGSESKIGTVTSSYKFYKHWKKIDDEKEKGIISLETILKGTCSKQYLIDLIENFILYKQEEGESIKIISQNHQFLGVNNAINAFNNRKQNKNQIGVFWHTPGSGKSFSMVFFSQKILRRFEGNYTFLILTDREELDGQIYSTFQDVGAVTEKNVRAKSGSDLKKLLKEDHRFVFTLIHKFGTKKGDSFPKINDREDIIVIVDEAHRTQYDTLAKNLREALPNASFLAFTGTPLIDNKEELTRGTFGDYVSTYNFKQSIDDGATVPVFHDNRVPELQLTEKELNKKIYDAIDEQDVDKKQEEKLKREFTREYEIITRKDRLKKVSKDIVSHFLGRGYEGKAMVVSVDKITTVKMYNNVKEQFNLELEKIKKQLSKYDIDPQDKEDLERRRSLIENLDMAVVVSKAQDEVEKFKKEGLDIVEHRKRLEKEDLETKFKEPTSNFKIVFVTNMWMTGFDVPTLSTLYLDKPMKNHTLMQTLARINRVAEGKGNGLIVDYIGIFRNLQKALSIYALGTEGDSDFPIKPKETLIEILEEKLVELDIFNKELKINPKNLLKLEGFELIKERDDIVSVILEKEKTKNKYLTFISRIITLYKSILPDVRANKFSKTIQLYKGIKEKIEGLKEEVDIDEFIPGVRNILDKSILAEDVEPYGNNLKDISKLNFEKLKEEFEKGRKGLSLENLKKLIEEKLDKMVRLNEERYDFYQKYKELIEEYNSGSRNIDDIFEALYEFFSQDIKEEDERGVKENLTEEELALYDKLKKEPITEKEKKKVKEVAKKLLEKVKEPGFLGVDWRKKPTLLANVNIAIRDTLLELPQESYPVDLFNQKLTQVFQHIYENYYGEGKSVYV